MSFFKSRGGTCTLFTAQEISYALMNAAHSEVSENNDDRLNALILKAKAHCTERTNERGNPVIYCPSFEVTT